ncbi:hypothetical protein BY458DRAFT_505365 [Sporodiniella umbellata]|nr:hypothetical protein BY458DRAFT_505365 [Sporodiniella umbellata]
MSQSKCIRQSPGKKITPFVVKRKQINHHLLDPTPLSAHQPFESKQVYEHLMKDKDEKIKELKTQLESLNKELTKTRHQCRLLENERGEFETSVNEKYTKEKLQTETELRLLKETHVEKVQDLSTYLNQLSSTVALLRNQLQQHNIKEEHTEEQSLWINHHYKKDAQFIQEAYQQVKQETSSQHPLWSHLQSTTSAIRQEIDTFQAWKTTGSIPVHELAKLVSKEQKSRKTLFGRRKG